MSNGCTYGDLPTPIRSGYSFLGWYTCDLGGTRILPGTVVNISADQTLYAHWSKIKLIKICQHTYNSSGYCTKCGAEYQMSITGMPGTIYYAVKADVPVRTRPYASNKIVRYLSANTSVVVVGKGTNAAGNLWYKLNDGTWVYGENLRGQLIANGTYVISTKLNSKYVLDISGAGKYDGANLQLWEANNTAAQTFTVTMIGNDCYKIVNTNSGKAISAADRSAASGTNVCQNGYGSADSQIWKITDAGSGTYFITCKASGMYLDVDNAHAASGTNVKLFVRNSGYMAQNWMFTKVG